MSALREAIHDAETRHAALGHFNLNADHTYSLAKAEEAASRLRHDRFRWLGRLVAQQVPLGFPQLPS